MVGMTGVHWAKSADTIWVRAGPAPVLYTQFDSAEAGETYWSRVVAFPRADSTYFRLYVAVVPPAKGWAQSADSSGVDHIATGHFFAACQAIARASDVRWIRRIGDPGDEERLSVWSRVP
jgi:hypothetical protein